MDKKITAKIAKLLAQLGNLPSFHKADLFTNEIVEMLGYQIRTYVNASGRLVFACSQGHEKLAEVYEKVYGYKIQEKEDADRTHYRPAGSDSMYDLSPATIARLLKVGNTDNEYQSVVPVFIMRISQVAEDWKVQFEKMTRDATTVYKEAEEIYEDLL